MFSCNRLAQCTLRLFVSLPAIHTIVLSWRLQVFGRAAKYSLFDPSKEMVFITMDKEQKAAGKAAVDILGNQIGKSSGSWIMQVTWHASNTATHVVYLFQVQEAGVQWQLCLRVCCLVMPVCSVQA